MILVNIRLVSVLRPTFSGDRPPSKAFLVSSARDMGKRCIHDVSNTILSTATHFEERETTVDRSAMD